MDELRDKFVEKQNQRIDDSSFKYLKNNGIFNLAVQAFEEYADKNDVPNSRIVRNAYLLQYERISQNLHDSGYKLDDITKQMEKVTLGPVNTLQHYAGEYLKRLGEGNNLSDDLYAATIAYTALMEDEKAHDYIALIGAEAFKIAKTAEKYRQNPDFFNKDYSDMQSRALHLVMVTHELNSFFKSSQNEIKNQKSITPDTSNFAQNILNHLDNIRINEERSSLEEMIMRKSRVVETDLKDNPVAEQGKIVPIFPTHDPA